MPDEVPQKEVEILVVDDSRTQAELLRYALEEHGYRVVVASSGREGLEKAIASPPTLVISDIVMPGMNGYELCRSLKEHPALKSIPVVLLTTLSDPEDVIRGLDARADCYLTKPYDEAYLLATVESMTDRSNRQPALHPESDLEVSFAGKRHVVRADRQQMLDLLLSTYQNAVQQNRRLVQTQLELRNLNDQLCQQAQRLQSSETNYRQLLESNTQAMLVVDRGGIIRFANRAAEMIFDRNTDQLVGSPFPFNAMAAGEVKEVRVGSSARAVVAELRLVETNWQGDSAYLASLQDITDRKRAEEALQQANQQLKQWIEELELRNRESTLLSQMRDVLQACLTIDEAYQAIASLVQPLFPEMSGSLSVVGSTDGNVETVAAWGPLAEHMNSFKRQDCWALRRVRPHLVEDTRLGMFCSHLVEPPPLEYCCIPMMAQGEAIGVFHLAPEERGQLTLGRQQLAMTVAENIALSVANLKLRETLHNQSIRDPLTGLYNRRFMEEAIDREFRRAFRRQREVSIVMLDIDHFKRFNDTYGHEAGDAVLREVGEFLLTFTRKEDTVARYGGEEFMLLIPEVSTAIAIQRAEQLRERIRMLDVHYCGQPVGQVTMSLGVAAFPEHGPDSQSVIRTADLALYRAKEAGRDRVMVG